MEIILGDTFITASENMPWLPSPTAWPLTIVEPLFQLHLASSCSI